MTDTIANTTSWKSTTVPVAPAAAGTTPAPDKVAQAPQRPQTAATVLRKRALRQMLFGAALIVLGVVITVVTYKSAESSGGGTYFVMWGPVIVGVLSLFRGARALVRTARMR